MKKATFSQGYDLTANGDRTTVSFNGDGISWAAYVVFPIVFLGMSGLFFTSFWIIPLVLILGSAYLIYLMSQRQSFVFTTKGIEKGGVVYDQDKISEILIDNPLDQEVAVTGHPAMFVGGTGTAGASITAMSVMANATTSAAVGASMAITRSSAKRRFRVRIRYGAKLVTLARNLKQDRAITIFDLLTKE